VSVIFLDRMGHFILIFGTLNQAGNQASYVLEIFLML